MKVIPKAKIASYLVFCVFAPCWLIKFCFRKRVKLDDIAAIMFSSGSEGTPKGVMLSHRNLMGNIQQLACIFNVTRADVMLSELPLFHSFGLTVTTLLNLTEGCPIVTVADPTDVKTMARVCAEFRVTAFVATPTFLRAFTISRYVHPMALKYVRLIIAGAEALRPELATAVRLKFGKEIYEDVVLFDRIHQFGLCRRLGCNGNAKAVAEHRGVGNGHIQVADLGPQQARHVGGREDLAVACGHLELVEHRKDAFDVGALERLDGKARQAGLYLNAKTALQ